MRRSSAWAWALAAAAVALLAFALALSLLAGSHGSPWWEVVLGVVAVLSSAAIGLLVVVRRGGHLVGWLLLANALIPATWFFTESYAQYAVLEDPGALPGAEWAVLWAEGRGRCCLRR